MHYCPNPDHDGEQVPALRRIIATNLAGGASALRSNLCTWCAEGYVAHLLRENFTVTITPYCECGKHAGHRNADPDSRDWACLVPESGFRTPRDNRA